MTARQLLTGPTGLAAFAIAVAACSAATTVFVPPPDESYAPEIVAAGEDVHLRTCAVCHGRDGGGGAGPNIRQVWERLSIDEHTQVIIDGRKAMPAFGRNLTAEDIAAVVAYQRTGWSDPQR